MVFACSRFALAGLTFLFTVVARRAVVALGIAFAIGGMLFIYILAPLCLPYLVSISDAFLRSLHRLSQNVPRTTACNRLLPSTICTYSVRAHF